MLTDGIILIEGSSITNITVASGGSFPNNPNTGEMFIVAIKTNYMFIQEQNGV